jgi:TolB protein
MHRTTFRRVLCGIALLELVVAGGITAAASATAPGKNGAIAFRRYFDDQQTRGALFTVQPDGTHARQLTHPPRGIVDDQPSWAPDGSLIAFTRCAPNDGFCHVWTVAPDGSGITPVGPLCPAGADEQTCPDDGHADFSPDSKQLVFVQATGEVKQVPITGEQIEHAAIAVMNRGGSGRHVVYTTRNFAADLDYPVFSPDGKRIVFERHNSGLSRPVGKHAVFVIGVDGSNLHRITPWAENDGDNPDWSPDGNWIIYHSHLDDPTGQAQYYLVHPNGTGRRQLTHFAKGTQVTSASFSPDGTSVAFAKGPEGGNIDVYTMRLDGTELHRLTRSKLWDSGSDWGPGRASTT